MTNNKLKEDTIDKIIFYINSSTPTTSETKIRKLIGRYLDEYAQIYHRQRVEGITDEVIELKYQEKYKLSKRTLMDAEDNYNQEQRRDAFDDGAKWLKEKLLSNESLE